MTEPIERPRANGVCSYCGKLARPGVVVAEIHGDSGPGWIVVRHEEHVGLAKRPSADQPRTWTG